MKSKFQVFANKELDREYHIPAKLGWNTACKTLLRRIKFLNKTFEGNWQHEDISGFIEDIENLIEK